MRHKAVGTQRQMQRPTGHQLGHRRVPRRSRHPVHLHHRLCDVHGTKEMVNPVDCTCMPSLWLRWWGESLSGSPAPL